ncbi:hypothetical protein HYZ99_01035 [Candidatus Peregrinibacteria bacterium]|nr:hypothetical protein [Candidatus Peregrinibacteria bacterium]
MSRYKNLLRLPALFLLVWVLQTDGWNVIPVAYAQGADTAAETFMNTMTYLAGFLITVMNLMMWVLFELLDILLNPTFIFDLQNGKDGALLGMLHEIWQLMRDLVNVIFAVLLIVGAIITIVKANMETVKQYRVKFILAVVLVNFSWFVPRVIIDVSQILTYTIYQIPNGLVNPATGATLACQVPVTNAAGVTANQPCKIVSNAKFLDDTKDIVNGTNTKDNSQGWKCPLPGLVCYQEQNYNAFAGTSKGTINGLIVNHARLSILAQANSPAAAGAADPNKSEVRELLTFLMRLILVLVIHIALFFPMLALVIALFIRIPILWVTMAFMPLAFLGFVIGDKMGEMDTMKKIWSRFLGAAFLPALAAIPLAIGFVMVNAGATIPAPLGIAGKSIPLLSGVKDIWQLLWMFIAIFIMWTELFPILKKDELIGKFTAPIEQYGAGLGKFALKAPLAAPILPAPGGGTEKVSPLQLLKRLDPRALNADLDADGRFGGKTADADSHAREVLKKNRVEVQNKIENVTKVDVNLDDRANAQKFVNDIAAKLKDIQEIRDDKNVSMLSNEALVRNALTEGTAIGLKEEDKKKLEKALKTLGK